jgi:hypothetical protein
VSDTSVDIVDLDVGGEGDVAALYERMREWLLGRGVIVDERTDALGGGALWLPGSGAATTVHLDPGCDMEAEGIEFVTERRVFHPGENVGTAARCPRCGCEVDLDDWVAQASEMFTEWLESPEAVDSLPCPGCGAVLRTSDWEWADGERWALGEFAIRFWTWWWPLSEDFVADLTRELGHETCVIAVRI